MIGLMIAGVPLAWITMSLAIGCTLAWLGPAGLPLVASRVYGFVNEYVFVAIPLFVLMACILERSGVARDLYDAMRLFAGNLPGGVAVQTTLVAVVMAAMTGIIGGEIVLLGLIALPQMMRLGYDRKLAIGIICAGGSLGTMIPPSVVLIVYGLTAGVSISELFLASALPGLLLAAFYIAYVMIRCILNPALAPRPPRAELDIPFRQKMKLLKGLILPILVVIWVLGSIYGGIASVTESAGVGALGAIIAAAARGELSFRMLRESAMRTMITVGVIIWLTLGANAFIGIYNIMGGTTYLRQTIGDLPLPPFGILLVMMGILLVLGFVMDWIGICLLTMPIFVPVIKALGYDPVWFGVLFCMNMQVSYLTPPFGPAAFYLKSVAPPEIELHTIFSSLLPFILLQVAALMLVMLFPGIATLLPSLMR
ncbi:TRAP transporter large permease subunit (plasmid) [Skermanella sp. TT6]|uniref:TRAP transporter large permease protein n=1 Tax=Skermanella cutis TaxID=2775420 RepID=A0ABX7BG47_9PROT|nr:TRAP transporter large permease subunit [Skermanella sp. TT6]QQP93344.1 TRAP transporter large permease subunit [Skermanella sp. TT6]